MSQQQPPDNQLLTMPAFDDEEDDGSLPLPKRPWWRRRIVVISAILLLVLLGFILWPLLANRKQPITYQYQKVSQSDFALTVSATGPLRTGTYNIVFSGSGTISEIDTKVGQTVKEGQVLAKLDKTSLQDALDEAQASLLSAQATLGSDQASLNQSQSQGAANVAAAQTALSNAQAALNKTVGASNASIIAAQTTLSNDLLSQDRTMTQGQADIAAAQTTLSDAQANLSKVKDESDASIAAAQTALSNAQDNLSTVKAQAAAQIQAASATEQQAINTCNTEATPPPNCVAAAQATYNQAVAQANTSVATAEGDVATAQKSLASAQAQAAANNTAAQNQVNDAQKSLISAQAQAAANNTTAQNAINTAQGQLQTAQTSGALNNTTAQNAINTAQSQLATAQQNAAVSIATAQGAVASAQGQFDIANAKLQTAQHNLNNSILTAPHDGIVTEVNGTVGGTPGIPVNADSSTTSVASGSTFIKIVDPSSYQVQANVNESDVGNLKPGQPAEFTVSAYGDKLFHGTVSSVPPDGQTTSNVVTYPVLIDVDMNSLRGATLLPTMTANVTITVVQHQNAVLIPVSAVNFARAASSANNGNPAIINKSMASTALDEARQMVRELQNDHPDGSYDNAIPAYVLEPSGKQFVAQPVVLGLTDETVYEVLKGLSPGETIVVGVQK